MTETLTVVTIWWLLNLFLRQDTVSFRFLSSELKYFLMLGLWLRPGPQCEITQESL